MRKQIPALLGALVIGMVVGAIGAWSWTSRRCDRELLSLVLVHQLYDAGYCADLLGLIQENRQDTAIKILEMRLVSSLRETDRTTSSGPVDALFAAPYIVSGARKAQAYALAHELGGVTEVERAFERIGMTGSEHDAGPALNER